MGSPQPEILISPYLAEPISFLEEGHSLASSSTHLLPLLLDSTSRVDYNSTRVYLERPRLSTLSRIAQERGCSHRNAYECGLAAMVRRRQRRLLGAGLCACWWRRCGRRCRRHCARRGAQCRRSSPLASPLHSLSPQAHIRHALRLFVALLLRPCACAARCRMSAASGGRTKMRVGVPTT